MIFGTLQSTVRPFDALWNLASLIFTLTRSLRALVRIGVFPYGHVVNWSNPYRGGARCMGPMKLRWGSADGMAIRGRGVELHITQCSGGSDPRYKSGALRDM